jgi:hypothetical protein
MAPAPVDSAPAKEKESPAMTANGSEELPGGSRRSRRGWNGVRADKSCFVSCGRFVLPCRARMLLSRALPRFFPVRGVRAIPFPPASKPRASRSRKPRVFHRRTSFFDRFRAINHCCTIKRTCKRAQRLIERLAPKRNVGAKFSV